MYREGEALLTATDASGRSVPGRARNWDRWYRPTMVGLTLTLLGMAAYQLVTLVMTPWGQGLIGSDVVAGYLPGAQAFLGTGSPYTPAQLAAPWPLDVHSFIHPPAALPLFIVFLPLPLPLWWAVPIAIVGAAVWRMRPAPWTWPLMAACLVWPRSTGSLIAGNSDMWAMAAVAAGAAWGWPITLLAIKPTFAPLALLAVRDRSAWIAGVVFAVLMIPFAGLWIEWLTVIHNAGLSPAYSLLNLPLVLIGVVAWLGRGRGRPDPARAVMAG